MKIGSWIILIRRKKVTPEEILREKVETLLKEDLDLRGIIARCARSIAKDKFGDIWEAHQEEERVKTQQLTEFILSENLTELKDTEGLYPWEKRLVMAVILAKDFYEEMVRNYTREELPLTPAEQNAKNLESHWAKENNRENPDV